MAACYDNDVSKWGHCSSCIHKYIGLDTQRFCDCCSVYLHVERAANKSLSFAVEMLHDSAPYTNSRLTVTLTFLRSSTADVADESGTKRRGSHQAAAAATSRTVSAHRRRPVGLLRSAAVPETRRRRLLFGVVADARDAPALTAVGPGRDFDRPPSGVVRLPLSVSRLRRRQADGVLCVRAGF